MAAHHLALLVPSHADAVVARCACGWVSAPCGVEPAAAALRGHVLRTSRQQRIAS